jgi:hypothetical protein
VQLEHFADDFPLAIDFHEIEKISEAAPGLVTW